jgi:mRNA interferase RelE/StbE
MRWTLLISTPCKKQFKKLGQKDTTIILAYLQKRILNADNPKDFGKPMLGDYSGYWRYRIGNFRIIVDIIDDTMTIVAVSVDHRRSIYQ